MSGRSTVDFGNVVGFFDHGRAVARLAAFTDVPAVELALALYGSPIADDGSGTPFPLDGTGYNILNIAAAQQMGDRHTDVVEVRDAAEALRVSGGDLGGWPAAHRLGDQGDAGQAEVVEQGEGVVLGAREVGGEGEDRERDAARGPPRATR